MQLKRTSLMLIIALLLAAFALPVSAQDDVTVTGDANAESLQVVQQYIETRDTSLLADDVVFYDATLPQPAVGVNAVGAYGPYGTDFYSESLTDILWTPQRYIVSGNTVVVEYEFTGQGGPDTTAAGVTVTEPMVAIYEVENGVISSANFYYDAASLQYQLGYTPYADPYYDPYYAPNFGYYDPYTSLTTYSLSVDDIIDFGVDYYGETVTVRGDVGRAVGENAFVLNDQDLIDISPDSILVIDNTEEGLDFIQLPDADVVVSGTVSEFIIADLDAEYDFDFDLTEDEFGEWEGTPVIIATTAVNLNDVETLETIDENPQAFVDQTVTVRGEINELLGLTGFLLEDNDDLIDLDQEYLPVVDVFTAGNMLTGLELDSDVVVTGTIRTFVLADFEAEYDFDFDDDLYADYENQPVLVADTIFSY